MTIARTRHTFGRWLVVLPMSLTIACGGRACSSTPAVGETTPTLGHLVAPPLSSEQFGRALQALEAAERQIPRDTFDPKAIVQGVGADPVKLFEWVRDNTYWVPYRGALRGAVGVLMDGLGNSLDRSLLLAELLRTAGHRVRLAHGVLPEAQGRTVLTEVRAVPVSARPRTRQLSEKETEAELDRYATEFQLDATALRNNDRTMTKQSARLSGEVSKSVAVQAPFLAAAVGASASTSDSGKSAAAISDHWWVQRQQGEQWIDFDPLLPTAVATGSLVAPDKTLAFDQPSGEVAFLGSVHEVTIRVIVEQWSNGKLSQKTALEETLRPAELIGQPIVLQNMPLGWPSDWSFLKDVDPIGAFKARALKVKEWLPYLTVGNRQIKQSSFTETGELNLRPGQGSGVGVGTGAVAGGFDALSGDDPSPPGQLTGEWIEYEIRVPGESLRTVRREVFNVFDSQSRSRQVVPAPSMDDRRRLGRAFDLLATIQILTQVCRLSKEYVARQTLSLAVRNREALSGMVAKMAAGNGPDALEQAQKIKPMFSPVTSLALARFEWNPSASEVFIDSPNILTYRTAMVLDREGAFISRQGFDIVSNPLAVRAGSHLTQFDARLTQGVTDTNVEGLLVPTGPGVTAATILGTSRDGDAWVTIRGKNDPALSAIGGSALRRSQIEEALSEGYVAVVPRSGPSGPQQWAWWRIDPRTGDTVGIGDLGWGQAMTEKSLALGIIVGLWSFQISTSWCLGLRQRNSSGPISPQQQSKNDFECLCLGVGGGFGIAAAIAGGGVVGFAVISLVVATYCVGMTPQAP